MATPGRTFFTSGYISMDRLGEEDIFGHQLSV
jgi:hypothetical protein